MSGAGPAWRVVVLGGSLALALASMGVCGYGFGVDDQAQYLAQAVAVRDPGALAGDPYLVAFDAIKSVVWGGVARAVPEGGWAWAALVLMVLSAAGSGVALAWLADALLGPGARGSRWRGAACLAPAAALVVPKEQNWFGLVALADVEFTATVMAVPIALASMACFVRGRAWWSLAWAAAAVPVHGQTGAYALCAWTVACAWAWRGERGRLALVGVVAAVGAGAFGWARSIGGVAPGGMDAYRAIGLELYAPLIDPSRAPATAWGACAGVVALGALAWPGAARMARAGRGVGPAGEGVRRLGAYALASMAMPAAFTLLIGAGWDEPLAWRLMAGRGFMLAQLAAVAMAAVWAAQSLVAGGRGACGAGLALAGLVAWPVEAAAGGGVPAWVDAALLAAVGGLIGAGVALDGAPAPRARGKGWAVALALVLASGLGAWALAVRAHPWTRAGVPAAWAGAQAWARANTAPDAVFVTPPYRAGWRVGAHRRTFGELRDGGLLFYAGEPALAWRERMRLLGFEAYGMAWHDGRAGPELDAARERYHAALRAHWAEIVRASGAGYVVVESGWEGAGEGVAVWSNGAFDVWRVGGGG